MLPTIYSRNKNQLPSLLTFVDDLFKNDGFSLASTSMKVDLTENNDSFILKADLPGIPKEDIQVTFKEGLLTIDVESKTEQQTNEPQNNNGEKIWRMERSFSRKTRSFNFDYKVVEDSIKANYEHGVLTLELPKKPMDSTKKLIQIE